MSHHDLTLLVVGFLVGGIGASVILFVRSRMYDRWAEATAQEAERIVTHPHVPSDIERERWDRWVEDAIAMHTADAMDRIAPVADVVPFPTQRDRRGGGAS